MGAAVRRCDVRCFCCRGYGDVKPVEIKTLANGVTVRIDTLPMCKLCRDFAIFAWVPMQPGEVLHGPVESPEDRLARVEAAFNAQRPLRPEEMRDERAAQVEDMDDKEEE